MSYGLFEVCRRYYRGLNVRSWTHEIFDPYGGTIGGQAGFRVNRYTDEQLRGRGIPMDMAPVVIMATREDAIAHPESQFLGMLFLSFAPPRFGFSFREQDVLRLAIEGHTDESIAKSLAESSSNVKKHFRAIYDKVELSGVKDALPCSETLPVGHRGTEMRRYVLNYLREHPEELHPYKPKRVTACSPVAVK
jgi:DNA-binding CsgD family transcriptional regulator